MRKCVLILFLAALLLPTPLVLADQTPVVDDRLCQALVTHTPDADVAYQQGVDVYGKPVVPADLDSNVSLELPQEITIPLTVDIMSFLKLDTNALPASAMKRNDAQLGTLTLRGQTVFFNGQPLTNEQQDNLAVMCLKPR
jgi:hypothetical protein